ncbi:hypothetical protein PO909_015816 [Leuciscus waleckii]
MFPGIINCQFILAQQTVQKFEKRERERKVGDSSHEKLFTRESVCVVLRIHQIRQRANESQKDFSTLRFQAWWIVSKTDVC